MAAGARTGYEAAEPVGRRERLGTTCLSTGNPQLFSPLTVCGQTRPCGRTKLCDDTTPSDRGKQVSNTERCIIAIPSLCWSTERIGLTAYRESSIVRWPKTVTFGTVQWSNSRQTWLVSSRWLSALGAATEWPRMRSADRSRSAAELGADACSLGPCCRRVGSASLWREGSTERATGGRGVSTSEIAR